MDNNVFYRVLAAGITGASITANMESLNPTHTPEKKIRNVALVSVITAATAGLAEVLKAKFRK